jgi:hypothetical protein
VGEGDGRPLIESTPLAVAAVSISLFLANARHDG